MNFNKHKFTVKEFLDLPVYESAVGVPVNTIFLYEGRQSYQQKYLKFILEQEKEEVVAKKLKEEAQTTRKDTRIKVKFWRKLKDGNVSEEGATITLLEQGLNLVDDTLVINTGA